MPRVDSGANAEPRAACVYAVQALGTLVRWPFEFDPDFERRHDRSLAALLIASTFWQFVPAAIVAKADVTRRLVTNAAHATRGAH